MEGSMSKQGISAASIADKYISRDGSAAAHVVAPHDEKTTIERDRYREMEKHYIAMLEKILDAQGPDDTDIMDLMSTSREPVTLDWREYRRLKRIEKIVMSIRTRI
jgi:hypothetical protein